MNKGSFSFHDMVFHAPIQRRAHGDTRVISDPTWRRAAAPPSPPPPPAPPRLLARSSGSTVTPLPSLASLCGVRSRDPTHAKPALATASTSGFPVGRHQPQYRHHHHHHADVGIAPTPVSPRNRSVLAYSASSALEPRPSLDFILTAARVAGASGHRQPCHGGNWDSRDDYAMGTEFSRSGTSSRSSCSSSPSSSSPLASVVGGSDIQVKQEPNTATPIGGKKDVGPEKKKRKARICTAEGCNKYVVDHGLCIRHGGGKRCYIEGCNCRAQNRGLCWKHGGFTICKVDNCTKRAKSRGICWSHGGGTRCKRDACSKIAVSLGLCWAHGGGKRCVVDDCRKPASERTNNMCNEHFTLAE